MTKISAIIITNNSAECIANTLAAVKWCDEVIIVDSGSADRTLEICSSYNCKTYHRDFVGYGDQKNYASKIASNEWVLSIDADEVVSEQLKNEIIEIFNGTTIDYSGFYLPITLVFCGRKFRYCENSKPHLRLYNKELAAFNLAKVHEKVVTNGKTKYLKNEILHYSFKNISQYIQKMNLYTTRAAQELFENNKKKSLFLLFFRFPFDFLKLYIFRGCVLEGFPGFIWSVLSAYYPLIKYFKLYELNKKP